MNKKVRGAALMFALCLAGQGQEGRADSKAHDFYFQQNQQRFINQPMDARMLGMSGSTSLTQRSALSTAQNPAGLGLMQYGDLSVSYGYNEVSGNDFPSGEHVEDQQNSGQVFGASPINPRADGLPEDGNFGLGWWGRNGDWKGDPTNTDSGSYQVTGAYGKSIGYRTSLGYGLTYQNDNVDSDTHEYDSSESFLHTLGVQHRFSDDLTFGGIFSLGHGDHRLVHLADNRQDQTVKQMSYGVGLGTEYLADRYTTLSMGIDYNLMTNNGSNDPAINDGVFGGDSWGEVMNVRIGIEHYFADWLALRAGYRYAANFKWDYDRADLQDLTGSAKYSAATAGAGIHYALDDDSFIRAINLDYAAEYRAVGDNDWQHLLSLSTPFNLCM